MLGVKVPRENAEALRKVIARSRLLDKSHLIVDDEEWVVIPVLSNPPPTLLQEHSARTVERDFPGREAMRDPIDDIRDIVSVPDSLKLLLPEKWERFGDVAVVKLDHALDPFEREVASAYASVLNLKAVLKDEHGISGEFRTPTTRLLFGPDGITTHLENGIKFKFDAEKIMFSSGNVEERFRMAELVCSGETVVDMFAGIGYFSLPLAVYQQPKKILSCEINPVAHSYLAENVRINHVEDRVEPILGDSRSLPGTDFADRIIMGYVKTTHEFLQDAFRYLKSGGVIHYHETCPNELLPGRPLQRINSNLGGGRAEILRFKEIKSYAPGVSHVVVDARIIKPS